MRTTTLLLGLLCATMAFSAAAEETPAASLAFTTRDRVVKKARSLMDSGQFSAAEALLRDKGAKGGEAAVQARGELSEIIQRTRHEYSLSVEGLLAKVRKSVPNANPEEVERWARESRARFRFIDGEKLYFRREPQNIFLFSTEAQQRRKQAGNAPEKPMWSLTDHLASIISEAEQTGKTHVVPVKHHVIHTLTIRSNHPAIRKGSVIRVWLPFPQEYRQQRDVKLIRTQPAYSQLAPSGRGDKHVSEAAQRSVYFEHIVTNPAEPLKFIEEFEYLSYAYYPKLDPATVQPLPRDWNGVCLGERPPHIVFTRDIRQQVAKVVGAEKNPLIKAQKIFRWVSDNIPWNAEDEYCIIPSFAIKGFAARRGDCGIQNTVFVTMCRIAGIPARWQSGFETKPGNWGMHDWAEIFIAPWGWLPADASYGVQKSSDPRVETFYCGHQDSYRMIVNLDWGRQFIPPKTSFRSEPADFQRGEVEVDGRNLYFSEWDYDTELKRDLIKP